MNERKILIASGGTGGHIFPAIVFGKSLQAQGASVKWLCGARKLEREIYASSGIEPVILPLEGSPLGTKSITKIFTRFAEVIKAIFMTRKFIKSFKPDEIFLFGGYVSFAPLIAAKLRGIPVTLHEQNAIAGKVTRLASKLGVKIITGWPECEGIKSFEYFGIPVREPVRIERDEALKILGVNVPENSKIVGIAGGSLGSGPLSEILRKTADLCKGYEFIFLSSKEKKDDGNKHFIPSQWDMNPFYSICDLLVCRAGGSTLAEVLKWEIPAVVIAWPGAADNHQMKNAAEFVKLSRNSRTFDENDKPENLARIITAILD